MKIEWSETGKRIGDITFSAGGPTFICSTPAIALLDPTSENLVFRDLLMDTKKMGSTIRTEIFAKEFKWPRPRKLVTIASRLKKTVCNECGHVEFNYLHEGLIFDRKQMESVDVFSIREFGATSPIYVTEEFAERLFTEKLKDHRLDNVSFREVGFAEK